MQKGAFADAVREYQKVARSIAASIRSRRWSRWRSSASRGRTRAAATSRPAARAYDELFAIWKASGRRLRAACGRPRRIRAARRPRPSRPVTDRRVRISHYEVARTDRPRRPDRDLPRPRPAARARRRAQAAAPRSDWRGPARSSASAAKRASPRSSRTRTSAPSTIPARRTASRSSSASCSKGARSTRWSRPMGRCAPDRVDRHRDPDRRCARRRAPPRHRPREPEAVERLHHQRRSREAAGARRRRRASRPTRSPATRAAPSRTRPR